MLRGTSFPADGPIHWIGIAVMIALALTAIGGLLGPFHLDAAERPIDASRRDVLRAWVRGWSRRRRTPLSWKDWFPNGGRVFLPFYGAMSLTVGGLAAVIAPGGVSRLYGALAMLGGVLLLALVITYVERPTWLPPDKQPRAGHSAGADDRDRPPTQRDD